MDPGTATATAAPPAPRVWGTGSSTPDVDVASDAPAATPVLLSRAVSEPARAPAPPPLLIVGPSTPTSPRSTPPTSPDTDVPPIPVRPSGRRMLVDADLPTAATLAAPPAPPSRRRSLATLVRTGAESAAAAASSTRRGASSKMRRVAQVALQLPLVRPAARKVWGKLRDGDAVSSDVEVISDGESSSGASDAESTSSSTSSAHAADVSARDPDPDSDATSASSSPSRRFRAPWTRIRRSHRQRSRRRRQATPFSDSSVSTLPSPRALPTHPLARLGIPAQARTRAGVVTPLGGRDDDDDDDDEGGDESVGQPLMVVLDPPPDAQQRPATSASAPPLCRRVAVNVDQLRSGPIDVDDGRRWLFFRLDPSLRRATHAVVVELAHHRVYVGDVVDADAVDLVAIGSARSVAVVDLDKAVVAGDAPPLALLLLGETQVLGLVSQSERDKRLFVRYLPFAAQDAWWADPAADEEEEGGDTLDWEFDEEGRERPIGMSELTALMRDLDAAHSAAADRYAHLQTTIAHTAAELREYRHLLAATDRTERSLRVSVPLPTPPTALAAAVAEDLARHTALLRNRSKVLAAYDAQVAAKLDAAGDDQNGYRAAPPPARAARIAVGVAVVLAGLRLVNPWGVF
ncbi:hypothetical protein AMAG_08358 [Allomyces macrogynus ATCC 38327]|uniref:Uncharacterized protein n=1 Tax=Allomyces macrogynus (strain ATCC 38327) TaxID=578462 RepID=A0A0L0SLE9_ALLM3|nr:hypothetical protein AMAG_08358 [Allomyces macrogynus ATCC 38327]|eukprot:KNE63210.1 hypothetical protein AMAG_08358 [Allomyces macrogynus ATCC 38327]